MKDRKFVIEPELDVAVSQGGIKEVFISQTKHDDDATEYIASVQIKRSGDILYLATRRKPNEARKFKSVDVAISALSKLIGAEIFTVLL